MAGDFIVKSVRWLRRLRGAQRIFCTETTNWAFVSDVSLLGVLTKSEFEHLSVVLVRRQVCVGRWEVALKRGAEVLLSQFVPLEVFFLFS